VRVTRDEFIAYQGEPWRQFRHRLPRRLSADDALPAPASRTLRGRHRTARVLAMIAIGTSIAGRVASPFSAIRASYRRRIFFCRPFSIDGPRGAALGGLRASIAMYALGQCRKIIHELRLAAFTAVTAGAARESPNGTIQTKAALAQNSRQSTGSIFSRKMSRTRRTHTDSWCSRRLAQWPTEIEAATMTTLSSAVRNVPAASNKALGGFATNAST